MPHEQVDYEVRRALNAADLCKGPARNFEPPYVLYGVRVTRAGNHLPYGRSTQRLGYLTHVFRGVFLAWRRGVLVGQLAKWRCGGASNHFRFVAEPDSPICPVCVIERPGRPT